MGEDRVRKVLHLIKEYRGNYPLMNEYLKALPPDRYTSVVCYLSGADDGRNGLAEIAAEVRYLGFDKKQLRTLRPKVVLLLSRIMKSGEIDIVHCHRHKATVLGTLAAAAAGVPHVISHVHGLDRTRSLNRYLTNSVVFRRVARIIAVSESVRRDIIRTNRNLDPAKVITVRNGIDIAAIAGNTTPAADARALMWIPADSLVFGTVGRLTATKGQSYLLDAFARIIRIFPHAMLVIVGEGTLHADLKSQARDLGISRQVMLTGYRTDVHTLLRGFDVFVLPSVAEGLSIALLEAMACRLPVIASAVGGIPEVIDNACGILVPAKDPEALARAMESIGGLPAEEKALLGDASRKRVEESFTTDIMHKSLREVYDSLA